MFYDFIKILKKCLKFWYVFAITGAVLIASLFVFAFPLTTFKTQCDMSILTIDKKKVVDDTGNLDYYDSLNESIIEMAKEFYVKDNFSEINEKFKTDSKLKIKVEIKVVSDIQIYNLQVEYPNKEVAKEIIEYIKIDFVSYVGEITTQEIPEEYRVLGVYKVYNQSSPSRTLQDGVINFCLIFIGIILVEIIMFGFLTLKNNKVEFDGEIETDFKSEVLVKNYDKNKKEIIEIIKDNNLINTLLVCENVDFAKNIFNDFIIDYKTYKAIKDISDMTKNKNIIFEIVKGKTNKNDINKIVDELNNKNFKNYYFITRVKEINNESSSNK